MGKREREIRGYAAALPHIRAAALAYAAQVSCACVYRNDGMRADRRIGGAKREFKNEFGRDILAGVEIGDRPDGYCRLYIYGPDSGIDSYVTRRELAMIHEALCEALTYDPNPTYGSTDDA